MVQHWRVQVDINGEMVLAIESASLCGLDLTEEQCDVVRQCSEHLSGFVGRASEKEESPIDNNQHTRTKIKTSVTR